MALYDDPPHSVTIYGPPTTTRDAGGGVSVTWPTVRLAAVPCSINTASATERELFQQMGLFVTHTIAFLSAALTTPIQRGDKIVADDTGDTYMVKGLRAGRAYGSIPAFTVAQVEENF